MNVFLKRRAIDDSPLKKHVDELTKEVARIAILQHVIDCLMRSSWQKRQLEIWAEMYIPKICTLVRVCKITHGLSLEEVEIVCRTFRHYDDSEKIADLYRKCNVQQQES